MSVKPAELLPLLAGLFFACTATAGTTYKENFSSTTTTNQWIALNDACLTASTASSDSNGIPGCTATSSLVTSNNPSPPAYVMAAADADKAGALRLTSAVKYQIGAILSEFTFPMSQGLQVTFTTYTYGGSKDGPAKDGADGISFMLTDGTAPQPTTAGGSGGSMGYSCSVANPIFEGMANAYLGLGIDEWGNFLNNGDNGPDGIASVNSWGNGEYQPQRIGLRGAGNTTWAALQALNSSYYNDSSVNKTKVTAACTSGKYVSAVAGDGTLSYTPLAYDYRAIASGWTVLPQTKLIADESTSARAGNTSNPTDYTKNAWPITYKLTLSQKGLLNFSYSYNNGSFTPVLTNHDVTVDSGTPPAKLRFGFSAGTGGSDNVHEITCFQASPLLSNSSAAANTIQSGEVKTSTQVYLASYSSDNWWGSLVADPLQTSTTGTLSVSTAANWDAKCVLTGGPCDSMGTDSSGNPLHTVAVQAPSARTLLTWNANGVPLEWASLGTTQTAALNTNTKGVVDNAGQNRLDWLRGGRTNEQLQSPPGNLRARDYVMGDIIDSSPTYVSAPYPGSYPDAFADKLYPKATIPENGASATAYSSFVGTYATRTNVVYVGGNDGLMHGFEAGSYDTNGNYVSTTNDGKEVIGYMPADVLANKAAKITDPLYAHDYLVDATPAVGDLFYGNNWHTWLVGGVGSSGREIYALDVTNPANFSETNAKSLVQGDWDTSTLSNLGNTVGTPIIARMHNGQWAIIFGNGLGGSGDAGIYIGLVNSTTGAVTFTWYDTGVANDGIAYVSYADLDADQIADYLYAGDTNGNVWRLDVTSNKTSNWAYSVFGNKAATPLFVAKDAKGNLQPITTSIVVSAVQTNGKPRVMLFFGTGQKTPATTTSGDRYATGTQTFYGIWDWDMSNWNTLAGTASQYQYTALTGTQSIVRATGTGSSAVPGLLQQSLVGAETTGTAGGQVLGYRSLPTTNVVCWQGSTDCTSGDTEYGWYFDLPDTSEQIIYNPELISGAVVVSTAIPPVISALQCNPGLQTGWTMAFNPATGGGLPQSFFPNASGSFGPNSDGSTVGGIRLDAVGTPATVQYGGQIYMVTQTVKGVPALSVVNPPSSDSPARVSWHEIRN